MSSVPLQRRDTAESNSKQLSLDTPPLTHAFSSRIYFTHLSFWTKINIQLMNRWEIESKP